jgi:hypothetical protein
VAGPPGPAGIPGFADSGVPAVNLGVPCGATTSLEGLCPGTKRIVGCTSKSLLVNPAAFLDIAENIIIHETTFMVFSNDRCRYEVVNLLTPTLWNILTGFPTFTCPNLVVNVSIRQTCADL